MDHNRTRLLNKVKEFPDSPGVYMFLDAKGRIIYVGKAIRLRRRVSSYFQPGRAREARLERLVGETRDVRFERASSEAEALIYEAGLIKDHSPKFNIELKDDKSYPFLKLTINETYPRLFLTRRRTADGALYYGPYVELNLLKEALSFMKRVFPLRVCRKIPDKVCLEYHIGQCYGPCEGKVSREEYREVVNELRSFLEGRKHDLVKALEKRMKYFSARKEYEKALAVKNRMEALTAIQQLHDRASHPMYGELDELQNALGLGRLPVKIECFDISNIAGNEAVGSMVRFVGGKPDKAGYRKFRIKEVSGIDDYSMIREVVRRRYKRLINEGKALPDLVLIDGGKGHLYSAREELKALGAGALPLAAIAKEHNHLYVETRESPIRLSPGSRLLHLVQRVRDEAHRFAITFHRKLHVERSFETPLRDIKGVGPAKEKNLLEKFGSIAVIREASREELLSAGVDKRTARAVYEFFHGK